MENPLHFGADQNHRADLQIIFFIFVTIARSGHSLSGRLCFWSLLEVIMIITKCVFKFWLCMKPCTTSSPAEIKLREKRMGRECGTGRTEPNSPVEQQYGLNMNHMCKTESAETALEYSTHTHTIQYPWRSTILTFFPCVCASSGRLSV